MDQTFFTALCILEICPPPNSRLSSYPSCLPCPSRPPVGPTHGRSRVLYFFMFTFRLVFSFVAPDPRVMFSGSPFSKCVYYPSGGVNRHSWRTDQSKWRRWLTPSMLYRIRKNIQTLKENEETNFMMFLLACTCNCFALIHTASRFCKSHTFAKMSPQEELSLLWTQAPDGRGRGRGGQFPVSFSLCVCL